MGPLPSRIRSSDYLIVHEGFGMPHSPSPRLGALLLISWARSEALLDIHGVHVKDAPHHYGIEDWLRYRVLRWLAIVPRG